MISAALVMTFFMQLRRAPRLTVIVGIAGFFWLAILVTLSVGDFLSRTAVPAPR